MKAYRYTVWLEYEMTCTGYDDVLHAETGLASVVEASRAKARVTGVRVEETTVEES